MKLSIITINKNDAKGLEKTIQSVICQTYSDFEYIVIDGASTDGSFDVLKKHSEKIDYWVSEPDSGIYNGMNKGIEKATGDYCLFLNSGDYLMENVNLEAVFKNITGDADIYYFDCLHKNVPDALDVNKYIRVGISHQNSIIRRSLFIEHGYYNEEYITSSDFEFFLLEIWKYKSTFKHIPGVLTFYDLHGISTLNPVLRESEKCMILQNAFEGIADSIVDYYLLQNSIYSNIIRNWGNSKILVFILRTYRFVARRLFRIVNKKYLLEKFEPVLR